VIENWNSANSFTFYGKSSEIATNRLDEQELSILCLHLLQICLVYVNTLMIQEVLDEQSWTRRITAADYRGLSPLIYLLVNPYGRFSYGVASYHCRMALRSPNTMSHRRVVVCHLAVTGVQRRAVLPRCDAGAGEARGCRRSRAV